MVKKEIVIDCPSHIYKYLKHHYNMEGNTVTLSSKFTFNMPTNSKQVTSFFDPEKRKGDNHTEKLILYMWNPSIRKAYAFCRAMEREFFKSQIDFMDGWVQAGASAKEALQFFFDRYHLTEYDYKFETAYKKWIRRNKEFHQPRPILHAL